MCPHECIQLYEVEWYREELSASLRLSEDRRGAHFYFWETPFPMSLFHGEAFRKKISPEFHQDRSTYLTRLSKRSENRCNKKQEEKQLWQHHTITAP